MRKYLKGECGNCGCRLLYKEPAQADGAPVLDSGDVVELGQIVTRCDGCGTVVDSTKPEKPKPAAKPKGQRRPQASKRARKRSRGSSSKSSRSRR